MPLQPGVKLGPYEIVELIGAGGMGEVYRARDPRLDRIVAVKVVKAAFQPSPDLRRRFDEEGRLAAQLDHPRICRVYDVGHDARVDYLVMEYLEGRSLADRLRGGALPLNTAIGFAIEIASAVSYAHARGVIHHDLKPANVFITAGGVKVIDFGLSTLRQRAQPSSEDVAALETAALPSRKSGSWAPGTAQYMSPERLQGAPADHRSDIFAFGALVYEMLTGRRAFEGANPAALLAAILTADPLPIARQEPVAKDVEWVVRRCLAKNPDERWQSMVDVEAALKWIAARAREPSAVPTPSKSRRAVLVAAAAAIATAVLAALGAFVTRNATPTTISSPVALTIQPPHGGRFTPTEGSVQSPQLAVSPDGTRIAFVASGPDGVPQIWIRHIDSVTITPLAGTSYATYPFWSSTGKSLGFFAPQELKRIDLDGGSVRTIAQTLNGRGGAWFGDVILFAPDIYGCIFKVSASGGPVQQITSVDARRHDTSHRWPQFLPDGDHFLYFVKSAVEEHQGIYLASLTSPAATLLVRTNFGGVYVPPHHLLYVGESELLAANLDLSSQRLHGDPVQVVGDVGRSSNFYGAFSASRTGVLAYAANASTSELVWITRDGVRAGNAGSLGQYADFRIAPDGRFVAVAEVDARSGRTDLRLIDLARGNHERLTTSPATDASPVWSRDGSRLVFRSNRERVHDLFIRSATDRGDDTLLLRTNSAKYPTDWSPDGRRILFHTKNDQTGYDIWSLTIGSGEAPQRIVGSRFNEVQGQISPDGRWLAYTSDDSGELQVYVQPLVGEGRRWPVSAGGASDPHWGRDGRELFYLAHDERLTAVAVASSADREPGTPRPLFSIAGATILPPYLSTYDVDPSGQRFLVRVPIEQVETQPLNVLANWHANARQP